MRIRNKIFFSLLLSILLHFLMLGLGTLVSVYLPSEPLPDLKRQEPIEIRIVDPRETHGYQIADISPPEKEERPDDAKFLGLYDSKVPQETVSPTSGPSSHAAGQKISHKEATEKLKKNPPKPKAKEEASEASKAAKETYHIAAKPKETSPKESAPPSPQGSNGEDLFEGLSEDFFPNYKVGDKTYLNVLKFPKIGYFVRMKKVFRTTFNPDPIIRRSFLQISRGQIEVVLGVTVDKGGRLAELMVIRSSGIPAYDQEALRTIKDSSPFAVPPSEILNGPGVLRMAWTFTVYM